MPRKRAAPRTRLPGRATAAATAAYAARFAPAFLPDFYRLIAGDLTTSSLGLGTYLGDSDETEDARYMATARAAIGAGINLIDSAINYRCQRSERAVGRALAGLVEGGDAEREAIVVCTKGGYIPFEGTPPASREEYHDYVRRSFYDAGVMQPADVVGGGHCLAPSYLAHQLDRSRANLGVDTIDVYYLHNPEQQLEVIDGSAFRSRLRDAFAFLEQRVAAGEIAYYGCATWNGFRVGAATRGHLNLSELVDLAAEAAGGEHHFRVVQLPINLAMPEAVRLPTQRLNGHDVTLLQAAGELGVTVIASATLLQARLSSGLPPQIREAFPALRTDAQRAIAFVRGLPAVTTALVGMKSPPHLVENLASAQP